MAFICLGAITQIQAAETGFAPGDCNDPMVEKGIVIDDISGTCLLCGNGDIEDLIDGDLSNSTSFTAPLTVLAPVQVVSIKDVEKVYASGNRVGYVIEPVGGILDVTVLGGFQIRTFKNGNLRETVTGAALKVQEQGDLRRISFVTTLDYDEVELRLVSVLGVLTSVRVYYAYSEPANGCDYLCINALVPPNYSSEINDPPTGIFGICLFCDLDNEDNVVDADTTNFAHIDLPIGVGGNAVIAVDINENVPANYDVGFAVRQGSGLLNLTLLGAITISTYKAGMLKESVVATSALADVTLLGATDINLIRFKATQEFDEVRIRVSGVSLLVDMDVFYAFVRPDDDNDGFTNCVDRCDGDPDFLDADGDATPDACDDPVCTLNAGLDLSACPPATTAQLPAASMGQTWSALSVNPAAATVSNAGLVSGMSAEGVYGFVLTEGSCTDTVYISRFESTLDASCNNPITGPKVIVTDPGGPDCLLCVGAEVVVDGVLSGSVSLNVSLPILSATTLIAVKDTSQIYPAGRRTGFVVQTEGGLLDATVLGNLEIRTYLNGVLQETATVSGNVLTANALTGDGALQRLSFVTTLPFNEVELVATSTLSLLTAFRVYYAFEEPATGCPNSGEECIEDLLTGNMTYCSELDYDRTGIVGIACVGCALTDLGNLLDVNTANYATIQLTVGVGAAAQIAVKTRQTIPAGYTAGFVISGPPNLLDATVLGGIRVTTYLNGVEQESELGSGGLLRAQVLSASSGRSLVRFVTSEDFDEVQLKVEGLVSALGTVYVYRGFVRRDSDGDGAPDCADKCCSGDDLLDANGDGVPDACDPLPIALNDTETTNEDTPVDVLVLANDDFGGNGAGTPSVEVVTAPTHGSAVVNNNGTPGILTDDYIVYTPSADYTGADQFTYRICDASNDCDTATVNITVDPVNDAPSAADTTATTPEDTPVNICANISDVDDNSFTTTLLCAPAHGTVSGLTNPSGSQYCLTYSPAAHYNGQDSLCILVCDGTGACDTSRVSITVTPVADPPVALNNTVNTLESQSVIVPVLNNDNDPDGDLDTSSVAVLVPPANGTATPNPVTGVIEYLPDPNFFGADTFQYTVCDQGMPAQCDTAIVWVTVTANKVRLTLKMQLQGALYESPDSLMRDELRVENKLPALEPYTALAPSFVHVNGGGGELVGNTASVFADKGANAIVDWVFIELRDSANLGLVVATRAALLQRDGDVVDIDGTSALVFQNSVPASYAVAIRHRNHLGCMTANAVALSGEGTSIDFIHTGINLWDDGTNLNGLEQKTINGKFALWAGNVNKNNSVVFAGQNNDKDPIFNQVDQAPGNVFRSQTYIYNGYHLGDVNLDGSAIFAGQRNDVDPIFNNVDSHPKNVLKSQTYIIRQQLAQ
ncbi:MAG TPA: cadherin-like domain-containing protein [Saprospiraceae bacterium]|nr:cadherin-like domain-containing protein [Saprospiraceae bacterium]